MQAHWLDGTIKTDPIDPAVLAAEGVLYRSLPLDAATYQGPLDDLASSRGYVAQDTIELGPETPNLDAICAKFVDEHHHDDDEVRFVLAGEGIFDIRSEDDRWMRVEVEAGDLIVVPKERHHRFFLTERKRIRCVRLFKDSTGWVPHYRAPH